MSSDDIWNKINGELSRLLRDQSFTGFHPHLEKIQQWSSVEPKIYPPDFFEFLLKLIIKMKADIQQGNTIEKLIEQARQGSYIQPEWDVNSVYQANGDVFQFVFNTFSELTPKAEDRKGIEIPVVLLAMKDIELQELISGKILSQYSSKVNDDFIDLKDILDGDSTTIDWVNRYHANPELWQPFSASDNSPNIKDLIIQAIDSLQESYEKISFFPSFKDIRTLNADRALLRTLRQDGCIVAIDVVSLCHPKLFKAFQQSLLDAYPSTFVVSIAPIYNVFPLVRQMTTLIQLNISEMEFSKRRTDKHEEFGACKEIFEEGE